MAVKTRTKRTKAQRSCRSTCTRIELLKVAGRDEKKARRINGWLTSCQRARNSYLRGSFWQKIKSRQTPPKTIARANEIKHKQLKDVAERIGHKLLSGEGAHTQIQFTCVRVPGCTVRLCDMSSGYLYANRAQCAEIDMRARVLTARPFYFSVSLRRRKGLGTKEAGAAERAGGLEFEISISISSSNPLSSPSPSTIALHHHHHHLHLHLRLGPLLLAWQLTAMCSGAMK